MNLDRFNKLLDMDSDTFELELKDFRLNTDSTDLELQNLYNKIDRKYQILIYSGIIYRELDEEFARTTKLNNFVVTII